jgi:hypothetical protein
LAEVSQDGGNLSGIDYARSAIQWGRHYLPSETPDGVPPRGGIGIGFGAFQQPVAAIKNGPEQAQIGTNRVQKLPGEGQST